MTDQLRRLLMLAVHRLYGGGSDSRAPTGSPSHHRPQGGLEPCGLPLGRARQAGIAESTSGSGIHRVFGLARLACDRLAARSESALLHVAPLLGQWLRRQTLPVLGMSKSSSYSEAGASRLFPVFSRSAYRQPQLDFESIVLGTHSSKNETGGRAERGKGGRRRRSSVESVSSEIRHNTGWNRTADFSDGVYWAWSQSSLNRSHTGRLPYLDYTWLRLNLRGAQ